MPKSTQTPPDADSKSRRKTQAAALQDIGEALVRLSDEQLNQMGLPDSLLDAVLEGKRTKTHAAIVRQMQYIGKVMRSVDAAAIQAKLAALDDIRGTQVALHHEIEHWRDRLVNDDAAVAELVAAYPHADLTRLRALARNARREHADGRPPKNSRELFRDLRRLISAAKAGERPA
jgi:ribosome-associated protein